MLKATLSITVIVTTTGPREDIVNILGQLEQGIEEVYIIKEDLVDPEPQFDFNIEPFIRYEEV